MVTWNLELLTIPQWSVPHRTTQERGHATERPASVANSCQIHFSTVGNLAAKFSRFSSYLLYLFQSRNQSWQQTPSVTQQQFSNSSVPPTIHFSTCSIFNYTISNILGTASLPISVNNWRSSRQQCLYSYFFVVKTSLTNKSFLQLNNHHVVYDGGKSGIWQFHAVTIISWCCQSHTSNQKFEVLLRTKYRTWLH